MTTENLNMISWAKSVAEHCEITLYRIFWQSTTRNYWHDCLFVWWCL